jgi:hypothetical protein
MLQQQDGTSDTPRAFIFVDGIKLHASADTIVADAYIWPLTPEVVERHSNDVKNLARHSLYNSASARIFFGGPLSFKHPSSVPVNGVIPAIAMQRGYLT